MMVGAQPNYNRESPGEMIGRLRQGGEKRYQGKARVLDSTIRVSIAFAVNLFPCVLTCMYLDILHSESIQNLSRLPQFALQSFVP